MIIQDQMKKLGYLKGLSKWIWLYHSLMSECDKNLIAEAFYIPSNENNKCTILVATDTYRIGIDNSNVKLVMQQDFFLSFDSMIQEISHIERKKDLAFFLLFTPKQLKIRDPKEVKQQKLKNSKDVTAINAQLLDKNRPILRINQVLNANDEFSETDTDAGVETDSNIGSKTGYGPDSEAGSESDFDLNNTDKTDLVSGVLATEADKS